MSPPERPAPRFERSPRARAPWSAPIAHRLIRHAARRAPADLADRLEEEWLSDLSARPSAISALKFAIGCCWATQVIAFEHAGAESALADHAVHPKFSIGYFGEDSGLFSRKPGALLTVIALHAALFYALLVGLGITGTKLAEPPLQNMSPTLEHPKAAQPVTPQPKLVPTLIDRIPPPVFPRVPQEGDDRVIISNEPPIAPPQEPRAPPRAVSRVAGGPGPGFPNTDDFYPSSAKRLEEQGLVAVQVCVDTHGQLTSAPTVAQSSHSARLDNGALELARAGSGHYRPNTEDNRPVDGCYPIRIRFQLRN